MSRVSLALCLALLLSPLGETRAADLLLNGQASVSLQQGFAVDAVLTGPPGAPAWLLADTSPGPTTVLGQSLPVGFSANQVVSFLGLIPPSGELDLDAPLLFDEGLIGLDIYMVAGIATGPGAPNFVFTNGAHLHVLDRNVQLAGNPLAAYPWFEFVRAFNANAPVSLAVDPILHPEVVGVTADVYVVSKKTRAQWLGDGTLVDVSGAPDTLKFSGGTIEDDTFTISPPGGLDSNAGLGVGVGYDVVVDLDRDGVWDHDDLIDGFSDEAGLYNVHDITQPGPLAVTEIIYSGGTWLGQDLYYPTDIANVPGQRPLVIVSHGNGHNYQWYDHIGDQLASYGFIVMSHQNNTQPGIEAASTTTLTNTDYLLGNLATIAGGALLGHVDSHRIFWIGHSRGGEGVARALDRLVDGTYTAVNFTAADIKLISSMAPTDFLGTASANPHSVTYHVWVGGADNDVNGCSSSDITQSYQLHDRAEATRLATGLYGVGHGDFHDSTGSVASGPCLVGKTDTHTIMRGYFVALAEHFLEGNIPSEDFLWRQWEHFRPIGSPDLNPCVVVNLQYRPAPAGPGAFVLDDFQTNPATNLSSSGGAVSGTVNFVAEGRLDDEDSGFTSNGTPFNGFTEGAATDSTRGLVIDFDGSTDVDLSFALPPAKHDVRPYSYLQFRAAQCTRHPLTIAALQDTTFRVELRDGAGHVSGTGIGTWGGGIEEPYQRTSCGTGVGWGNEFETIRIRLSDFTHDGSGLDLSDLAAVTFRFGPSFSSPAMGRLGLDDLMFTTE